MLCVTALCAQAQVEAQRAGQLQLQAVVKFFVRAVDTSCAAPVPPYPAPAQPERCMPPASVLPPLAASGTLLLPLLQSRCTCRYSSPWQKMDAAVSTGSGFSIGGRRILTNAHVCRRSTAQRAHTHGRLAERGA